MALPSNSLVDYNAESESTHSMTHGNQDDAVIIVVGSTGTGKSSFIRLLTGDKHVKVGNSLESETSDIQVIHFHDPTSARNVTIVDTPGFDDSHEGVSDTDILKPITKFLLEEYHKDRKLSGLIYVTRVSDRRFSGQSSRNLRMFRKLCGTESYKNVVILTTFWDQVATEEEGVEREEQLESNFFNDLVQGGALFMRHDCTLESAHQVLGHILTLEPVTVQIREEIRLQSKTLEDPAAGSMHREEVERLIAKQEEDVARLQAEREAMKDSNDATRIELKETRAQLLQGIAQWESGRSELKNDLEEQRKSRERLEAEAQKVQDDEVKEAVARALEAERNKSYMQKGLELAEEIPLVPNFIAKPYLGALGFGLDQGKEIRKNVEQAQERLKVFSKPYLGFGRHRDHS